MKHLNQLLIEVKIADAKARRCKTILRADNVEYANLSDAVQALYDYLRKHSIDQIERMVK